MTEPNVVKSRAQKIREGTMGGYFGSLPQRYSKYIFDIYCIEIDIHCVAFDTHRVAIDTFCVAFDIT